MEIGTVTPRPQPGNPAPRLFRLPADAALINRMGFNNDGAEAVAARLARRRNQPAHHRRQHRQEQGHAQRARRRRLRGRFEALADVVDYFVVNVSSPNTPGLRQLQEKKPR